MKKLLIAAAAAVLALTGVATANTIAIEDGNTVVRVAGNAIHYQSDGTGGCTSTDGVAGMRCNLTFGAHEPDTDPQFEAVPCYSAVRPGTLLCVMEKGLVADNVAEWKAIANGADLGAATIESMRGGWAQTAHGSK